MKYGWMVAAALIGTAVPAVAMAQDTSTSRRTTAQDSMSRRTSAQDTSKTRQNTVSTATGDVSANDTSVTDAMRKEQKDPNLIGSPGWWSTRATADGKPASAAARKP